MSEKGDNFFDEHIEKIVLAVVGLVCLWLLITRVLFSPNVVSYNGKKFSPGGIDNYILSNQAERLANKLSQAPEPLEPYKPRVGDFAALIESALSGIDINLGLPLPDNLKEVGIQPKYVVPWIGDISEVTVERIRAVAYVPTEEINEENIYEEAENKPNDIDFVTVEAKFDIVGLYERFYEGFAGEDVQEDWRDPCLAEPIFAAVQLQRKELLADGIWSDWQVVPRTRIENRREMFEIIEDVDELPAGGIKVRLLQFGDRQVQMELLQPIAYRIASAEEEWFPPSLHRNFAKYQEDLQAREKREAIEERREERERALEEARAKREKARAEREKTQAERRNRTVPTGERGMDDMSRMMMRELSGGAASSRKSSAGRSRRDRDRLTRMKERREREKAKGLSEKTIAPSKTMSDFYDEFDEILITDKIELGKMSERLVFWAHDDTVEPEKNYRYRIRLGVFNPIAGTNQFSEQDRELKNKVVLWSEFSNTTEAVEIPGTLYFFPYEIQEAAKTVTVTVCRYVLGYWYSRDFPVNPGEVIGRAVDYEADEEEKEKGVTVPETIDYATGAVLVDSVRVNDWTGGRNLRPRIYYDMLYSSDGSNIEHRPIRMSCWPEELWIKFNEIKKFEKEPRKPLRDWGKRAGRRRPSGPRPRRGGERIEGGMTEEEMIQMLMGKGAR